MKNGVYCASHATDMLFSKSGAERIIAKKQHTGNPHIFGLEDFVRRSARRKLSV